MYSPPGSIDVNDDLAADNKWDYVENNKEHNHQFYNVWILIVDIPRSEKV